MPRGGVRPNSGRPKGAINTKTAELQARVAAEGITPLDFLLEVMRSPANDLAMRVDAAKSAANYVHAKLSSTEVGGPDGGVIPLNIFTGVPRDDEP